MEELLRLLEQYNAGVTELTDEELAQLQADIAAAAEEAASAAGDNPSEELLSALEQAADAVESIQGTLDERTEQAAERTQRAADALARIRNEDQGDGEDEQIEEEASSDDEEESTEDTEEESTDEVDEPLPVAASTAPAVPKPRVPQGGARTNARGYKAPLRRPAPPRITDLNSWAMTAAANLPDIPVGKRLRTKSELAEAFSRGHDLAQLHREGTDPTVIPVLSLGTTNARQHYGDERFLTRDAMANEAKIQEVVHPAALAASGGICVNPAPDYSQPVVGTDARPVATEMMARFGADRGGVTTMTSPVLGDVAAGVDMWTAANDAAETPSDPSTKPCVTIECGDEQTTKVYAVTHCIKYGNFQSLYFPELVDAWTQLIAVYGARFAEIALLDAIASGSTDLDVAEGLSSTRDVLTALDRIIARYVSFHRAGDVNWRLGLPFWFRNMTRVDIARQMPVGTLDETLALADAQIDRWFALRGINVTWFWDGETGGDQIFGAQGDGFGAPWPDKVIGYLYPEGSWLDLDGGQIRIGAYRDDSLIGTNDAKFFYEFMEAAHFRGNESFRIEFDVCPDGGVQGTKDYDPCSGGS